MLSDKESWRSASLMLERHGTATEAEQCAGELKVANDADDVAMWRMIALGRLADTEVPPPNRL